MVIQMLNFWYFFWLIITAGATVGMYYWLKNKKTRAFTRVFVAEKEGFEPSHQLTQPNGLANRPLQPLEYFSIVPSFSYTSLQ